MGSFHKMLRTALNIQVYDPSRLDGIKFIHSELHPRVGTPAKFCQGHPIRNV